MVRALKHPWCPTKPFHFSRFASWREIHLNPTWMTILLVTNKNLLSCLQKGFRFAAFPWKQSDYRILTWSLNKMGRCCTYWGLGHLGHSWLSPIFGCGCSFPFVPAGRVVLSDSSGHCLLQRTRHLRMTTRGKEFYCM